MKEYLAGKYDMYLGLKMLEMILFLLILKIQQEGQATIVRSGLMTKETSISLPEQASLV